MTTFTHSNAIFAAALKVLTSFLKLLVELTRELLSILAGNNEGTNERPLSDGTKLFGVHNFRTGQADSGSDSDGWYEEDMQLSYSISLPLSKSPSYQYLHPAFQHHPRALPSVKWLQ